jgi:hypothetical protein
VSALYGKEKTQRPTEGEVDALADRVYMIRRETRSVNFQLQDRATLAARVRLLSAEISWFAARRSKDAPRIDNFEDSEAASQFVDRMKRPPMTGPVTPQERLEAASKKNQAIGMDRHGGVGLSALETSWFEKNQDAIDYYLATRKAFAQLFGEELEYDLTVCLKNI